MRNLKNLIALIFCFGVALILYGCRAKVQTLSALPCLIENDTDSLYIRVVGHGISSQIQTARMKAMTDAKMKILSYLKSMTQEDTFVDDQTWLVKNLPLDKECEKVYFSANEYHVYVRLSTPRQNK